MEIKKIAAMDTETDHHGGLGQWSIAFRDSLGQLRLWANYGAIEKDKVKEVFDNAAVVFHNYKYDARELIKNGFSTPKTFHDTMIAAYCLGLGKQAPKDSSKERAGSDMVGGLGLKYLARRHLGMTMKRWDEVKDNPEAIPEYNAADSVATYLLFEKWLPTLPKHYFTIDMPLLPVLMKMEDRGIMIDSDYLATYAKELDSSLAKINLPLNPFSPKQVQEYVYGKLQIVPWRFTETKQPSTDSEVLEKIDDPIVKQILEYRELFKDKGTYVDNYIKGRDIHDRIHAEFKQVSTSTGRLSCARPNLQNVDKVGNMRKLFIVPKGFKMVRMDWKKIEFGALAVLAKDQELIQAFLDDKIHQQTADGLGVDYDTGKHINFLMQNGGSAWGMSTTYGIPIDLCKTYFDKYFKRFPAIKRFQDETVAKALETKYISGYFGRTRRLDALFAPDWRVRKDGEKEAKTMPMQNLAAEIVKLAMIDLDQKHSAPMLIQVHDELLFEIEESKAVDYAHWLKEYVPKITLIDGVEFPVEVSTGTNWWECMQEENEIK